MTNDPWRKSSYSGAEANCVEVGTEESSVKIRDTKDRQGPTLTVNADAWFQFAIKMKN